MADTSFTSKALNTAKAQISASPTNLVGSVAAGVAGTTGTWSYKITPFNGGEGLASSGISYVNSVASGVSIAFTTVAEATDYRLYRSGAGYTGYLLVANSQSSPIIDRFQNSGDYYGAVNTTASKSRSLGSKASSFYEVGAGTRMLFKEAVLSNSHTDTVTFNLYVVPSGESSSIGNRLFSSVSLDAYETKVLSLNTVLEAGDSIQANASEIGYSTGFGVVSLKISGIEISDS